MLVGEGVCAALSVPVELDGGVIGTLDIYAGQPRDWGPGEVAALQAYAGLVASLVSAAVTAQVKGRLADQLQAALEHRWLIEQAKGVLTGRERPAPDSTADGRYPARQLHSLHGAAAPRPAGAAARRQNDRRSSRHTMLPLA